MVDLTVVVDGVHEPDRTREFVPGSGQVPVHGAVLALELGRGNVDVGDYQVDGVIIPGFIHGLTAGFDRDALAQERASWGLFRDRRADLYGPLRRLDGATGDP